MDETGNNLVAWFGLIVIAVFLVYGVKVFREWWDERKIPISTLIESRVIRANGEQGFATFDSIEVDGRTWLILDRGNGLDIPPEYFRPKQQCIAQVSGDPSVAAIAGLRLMLVNMRNYRFSGRDSISRMENR